MSGGEILVYALYAFAVIVPLLPGLLELRTGSDDDPLRIDSSYARDPRFLGKSMREKMAPILNQTKGEARVPFLNRKNEYARVVNALDGGDRTAFEDVVLSRGTLCVGNESELLDIYARGNVRVGSGSRLRTLAGDADADLGPGTQVVRWIDVNGNCSIGNGSDLGQSVSATGRVVLGDNVRFNRVFGRPVVSVTGQRAEVRALGIGPMFTTSMAVDRLLVKTVFVEPDETYDVDIIASSDVEVGPGACVMGSIKSRGRVLIGEGATVIGNIIARGTVTLKADATCFGHIFGEGDVMLEEGALVGERHAPKTLHASRTAVISPGACVFGWVIAERGGRT
ncbi:MAG TPA: hypothetical protein VFN49_10960 [Candidatus Aquilonibacter sp.]|nr:hypothetical protein [Candidatus Aquilonibacter sp.]